MKHLLFVLGLPGSGKSTVARFLAENIEKCGIKVDRFNDYTILKQLFDDEQLHPERNVRRFDKVDNGGFYIQSREVCDEALRLLQKEVTERYNAASSQDAESVILVEFARSNYVDAFSQLDATFLRDASVLFLDASISTCRRRVQERIINPTTDDDYFVSDRTFKLYYGKDDRAHLLEEECPALQICFKMDASRMEIMSTECEWNCVKERLLVWLDTTFYDEFASAESIELREHTGELVVV